MTADARDHGFASGQVGDRGCEVLAEGAFEVEFDDESDHAHALFDPRRSPLGPPFVTARGGEIG